MRSAPTRHVRARSARAERRPVAWSTSREWGLHIEARAALVHILDEQITIDLISVTSRDGWSSSLDHGRTRAPIEPRRPMARRPAPRPPSSARDALRASLEQAQRLGARLRARNIGPAPKRAPA